MLEAENAESALALLEEQPAHMILTDMVMPRMSGLEFPGTRKNCCLEQK